ncbi:hypothetical protein F4825DRAFT_454571 [Nemania diffusa]|nr:hypothetical protein F4825DRAFT_454571 [Nemania diffusa]
MDLEIHDDLDDKLEQLAYLSRLGHFNAAREFFDENLQDRIGSPYVHMQYAELLLSQGDYRTLEMQTNLIEWNDWPEDMGDMTLLRCYWDMMQQYAIGHKPRLWLGSCVLEVRVKGIIGMMLDVKDISSTQIKLFALAMHMSSYHMTNSLRVDAVRELNELFDKFSADLYQSLLQQGRVWDMHDLLVSLIPFRGVDVVFNALFGSPNLSQGICTIISDWTEHSPDVDISTNLALLGLLTSVIATNTRVLNLNQANVILQHALPLSNSIKDIDPKLVKSRPFLRWILEKARVNEEQGPDETGAYFRHLQSSTGVAYRPIRTGLIQYVPLEYENPGWKISEASPALKGPVQLGLQTAKEMGDYEMMVLSLQLLIRFSANPREYFGDLCTLHREQREDYWGYIDTLVSSYLVLETKEAETLLSEALSEQLITVDYLDYIPTDLFLIGSLLLCSLPERGRNWPIALRYAETSFDELDMHYETLAAEVVKKMDWDHQHSHSSSNDGESGSGHRSRSVRESKPDAHCEQQQDEHVAGEVFFSNGRTGQRGSHLTHGHDDGLAEERNRTMKGGDVHGEADQQEWLQKWETPSKRIPPNLVTCNPKWESRVVVMNDFGQMIGSW